MKANTNNYIMGINEHYISLYTLIIFNIVIMKKIMAVLSDESYDILKRYQKEGKIANLDTALDSLIRGAKEDE